MAHQVSQTTTEAMRRNETQAKNRYTDPKNPLPKDSAKRMDWIQHRPKIREPEQMKNGAKRLQHLDLGREADTARSAKKGA
jgi:hypothetical protein